MATAYPAADWVLLLAQAVLVALQAAWLTLGAYSNLRWPRTNKPYVDDVVTMELTKENPEVYEDHKHRAVSDPKLIGFLFRAVAVSEAMVAAFLWIAAGCLLLAALGATAVESARLVAILAVLAFTAIWGAFLVGGQWFHYWVSEQSPQNTHFFMLLWGIGTLIFLK
jgi:predicted small integral membrane protein